MVNYNGTFLEKDSNFFNQSNRAFLHGDVLFEQVRAVNGSIIFWEEHYFRLMAGMRILRMEIPMSFTMEFLESEILNLLNSSNLLQSSSLITIGIFRNTNRELTLSSNEVSYVIDASQLESPFYILNENPYEIELFRDYFVNEDMLSQLSTNNKTIEVIADIFARENGFSDCFLLNTSKNVVRTIFGTIFLVKGQKIKTPPLSDGVENTVMRRKLMEIIHALDGYEIEEISISPFELQKADEIFVLNIGVKKAFTGN